MSKDLTWYPGLRNSKCSNNKKLGKDHKLRSVDGFANHAMHRQLETQTLFRGLVEEEAGKRLCADCRGTRVPGGGLML